jgi:hypothetical protein
MVGMTPNIYYTSQQTYKSNTNINKKTTTSKFNKHSTEREKEQKNLVIVNTLPVVCDDKRNE